MSPDGTDAVTQHLTALRSDDAAVRCRALLTLAQHGGSLPDLRPFLEDSAPTVRVAAAYALWQTDNATDTLDLLVDTLRSALATPSTTSGTPDDAALMAGTVLEQMGARAVPRLIDGFCADTPDAHWTLQTLADIGTDDAVAFLQQVAEGLHGPTSREAQRLLLDLQRELGQ